MLPRMSVWHRGVEIAGKLWTWVMDCAANRQAASRDAPTASFLPYMRARKMRARKMRARRWLGHLDITSAEHYRRLAWSSTQNV